MVPYCTYAETGYCVDKQTVSKKSERNYVCMGDQNKKKSLLLLLFMLSLLSLLSLLSSLVLITFVTFLTFVTFVMFATFSTFVTFVTFVHSLHLLGLSRSLHLWRSLNVFWILSSISSNLLIISVISPFFAYWLTRFICIMFGYVE